MAWIELSPTQKKILSSLIHIYDENRKYIKGTLIAERTGLETDVVRSQMQQLKTLQLVEGVVGPTGAYKPTARSYDVLERLEDKQSLNMRPPSSSP